MRKSSQKAESESEKRELEALLKSIDIIEKSKSKFHIEKIAFQQQLDFINDEARLKALFCTRRAAKSYTAGIYLIQTALDNPGCNCLYVALTRDSAKGIIWKDILQELNLKYDLKMMPNGTALTMTLPNGSVIWVTGADSDESEMNKLLGKKYKLAILDEASMFSVNMHQLVYGVLKPATADQRGTICLLGTSSNITRGLFYDVTTNREPGWSLHTWTAHDNPHVKQQWQEELDDISNNRPLFMGTALFKQWYLNKWVIDEDAKVYRFNKELNLRTHLPVMDFSFNYVLGVDLGHSPDPSSFIVSAYHQTWPTLYFVHAEKHLQMDVTSVADKIRELEHKYEFEVKVIDNANKQAVAELNNRHKLNMLAADKTGKSDFINLMNTEFLQGNIALLPGTEALQEEYETLVWQTDNGKLKEPRKEHPGLPNHCTDGALYNWRHCFQYLYKKPKEVIPWNAQERWEKDHLKRLQEIAKKDANPYKLNIEPEFDTDLFDFNQDDKY